MIIGRTLEATFPPKHASDAGEAPLLRVEGLSGHGFDEHLAHRAARARSSASPAWSATASRRSCARSPGATRRPGSVNVAGKELSRRALLESAAYMPADRLTEGLMVDLNVRENTALTALDRLTAGPFVSRRREVAAVERELPSWRSRRRRSRRPSRRSPAATSRRS